MLTKFFRHVIIKSSVVTIKFQSHVMQNCGEFIQNDFNLDFLLLILFKMCFEIMLEKKKSTDQTKEIFSHFFFAVHKQHISLAFIKKHTHTQFPLPTTALSLSQPQCRSRISYSLYRQTALIKILKIKRNPMVFLE